jgi:hypothetical protein
MQEVRVAIPALRFHSFPRLKTRIKRPKSCPECGEWPSEVGRRCRRLTAAGMVSHDGEHDLRRAGTARSEAVDPDLRENRDRSGGPGR